MLAWRRLVVARSRASGPELALLAGFDHAALAEELAAAIAPAREDAPPSPPSLARLPQLPPLPPLETAPPLPVTAHEPARVERVVRHDAITGDATLDWVMDSGCHRYDDIDLTVHTVAADRFTIRPDDPLSARAEVAWTVRLERGDWRVETRTRTVLTATRDTFELVATLEARDGDGPVHEERWSRSIPRDLV